MGIPLTFSTYLFLLSLLTFLGQVSWVKDPVAAGCTLEPAVHQPEGQPAGAGHLLSCPSLGSVGIYRGSQGCGVGTEERRTKIIIEDLHDFLRDRWNCSWPQSWCSDSTSGSSSMVWHPVPECWGMIPVPHHTCSVSSAWLKSLEEPSCI